MAEGMDFLEAFPEAVEKALNDFDGKTKPILSYCIKYRWYHTTFTFQVQFSKNSAKEAGAAWMRLYAGKKRGWLEFRAVFVDEWAKDTSITAAELRAAKTDSRWARVLTSSVKAQVDRILGLLAEEKKKEERKEAKKKQLLAEEKEKEERKEEKKKQQEEQAARRAEEKRAREEERKRAPINKILAEFSAIGARK